jgi:hypothetical protein
MIPVIVQANFTDCHDLRMIGHFSDLVNPLILPICRGIRMYPDGCVYLLVTFRELNYSSATWQVNCRNDDSANSMVSRPFDHSIKVCIELPKIKMAM